MRILIADDHVIVRRGMQLVTSKRPGWTVYEAENAEQLFGALAREPIDILILELSLRGRSGIEIVSELRRDTPSLPVLILSSYPEQQYAIPSIRAGARGYIQKDCTVEEILEAIERIAAGGRWVSDGVAAQLADAVAHSAGKAPHELLSPRELEVMRLIATGTPMTAIANALSISVKTASTYRARVLEKTGFRSNADIVAYAIRSGLI